MPAFEKIPAARAVADGLRCSFCDQEPADDAALIAGPDVFICDECVASCSDLLVRDDDASDESEPSDDGTEPEVSDSELTAPAVTRVRLLTDADVRALVTMDELIEAMAETLRRFSAGEMIQPLRMAIPFGANGNIFGVMPGHVRERAVVGAKLLTVVNGNVDRPTHQAAILLFDADTGSPAALLAGGYITEARTAAVSAVSADLLAPDEAEVLAIIGSGKQARSHLEALEQVFQLSEVRVWSPTAAHQTAFLEAMQADDAGALVGAKNAEEAVRGADLVVLATSSSEPVVHSEWVKDGAHVISVGACRPDQREIDPALVRRGRLFVDSRASALAESGDVVMGIHERRFAASHILGELGEVVAGTVEGRRSPKDVTIFKSLGLAVEDLVTADLAFRRAAVREIGRDVEI